MILYYKTLANKVDLAVSRQLFQSLIDFMRYEPAYKKFFKVPCLLLNGPTGVTDSIENVPATNQINQPGTFIRTKPGQSPLLMTAYPEPLCGEEMKKLVEKKVLFLKTKEFKLQTPNPKNPNTITDTNELVTVLIDRLQDVYQTLCLLDSSKKDYYSTEFLKWLFYMAGSIQQAESCYGHEFHGIGQDVSGPGIPFVECQARLKRIMGSNLEHLFTAKDIVMRTILEILHKNPHLYKDDVVENLESTRCMIISISTARLSNIYQMLKQGKVNLKEGLYQDALKKSLPQLIGVARFGLQVPDLMPADSTAAYLAQLQDFQVLLNKRGIVLNDVLSFLQPTDITFLKNVHKQLNILFLNYQDLTFIGKLNYQRKLEGVAQDSSPTTQRERLSLSSQLVDISSQEFQSKDIQWINIVDHFTYLNDIFKLLKEEFVKPAKVSIKPTFNQYFLVAIRALNKSVCNFSPLYNQFCEQFPSDACRIGDSLSSSFNLLDDLLKLLPDYLKQILKKHNDFIEEAYQSLSTLSDTLRKAEIATFLTQPRLYLVSTPTGSVVNYMLQPDGTPVSLLDLIKINVVNQVCLKKISVLLPKLLETDGEDLNSAQFVQSAELSLDEIVSDILGPSPFKPTPQEVSACKKGGSKGKKSQKKKKVVRTPEASRSATELKLEDAVVEESRVLTPLEERVCAAEKLWEPGPATVERIRVFHRLLLSIQDRPESKGNRVLQIKCMVQILSDKFDLIHKCDFDPSLKKLAKGLSWSGYFLNKNNDMEQQVRGLKMNLDYLQEITPLFKGLDYDEEVYALWNSLDFFKDKTSEQLVQINELISKTNSEIEQSLKERDAAVAKKKEKDAAKRAKGLAVKETSKGFVPLDQLPTFTQRRILMIRFAQNTTNEINSIKHKPL